MATYQSLISPSVHPWHQGNGTITYSFVGSNLPYYYRAEDTDGDGTSEYVIGYGAGGAYTLATGASGAMTTAEQNWAKLAIDAWNHVAAINLVAGTTGTGSPAPAVTGSGALVGNLGGADGYGETVLPRSDDGSTYVDFTSVFAGGLNFFGTTYSGAYVNTNGSISFASAMPSFSPAAITAATGPMIAPFLADIDTRADGSGADSGPISVDLDTTNHVVTITWDKVGYYNYGADKTDSFQLQLYDRGSGNFDIVFRYSDINWTSSDNDSTGGLGGAAARAGFSAGNGSNYYELAQSGNQAAMLALDTSAGNADANGLYVFHVTGGQAAVGDITLGAGTFGQTVGGVASATPDLRGFVSDVPGTLGQPSMNGDVWINRGDTTQNSIEYGGVSWATYLQELGHALGLRDPDGDPANSANDPTNNNQYTVMSDVAHPSNTSANPLTDLSANWPITPMLYDIQALQALYGPNYSYNNGDTVYFGTSGIFPMLDGGKLADGHTMIATIWDAGGTDTFDFSNQTGNLTVDLVPGHFSTIGAFANNIAVMTPVSNNGAIVNLIEKAVGGSGNDTIIGNQADNVLGGNAGDDLIATNLGSDIVYGGAGSDTLRLSQAASSYQVLSIGSTMLFLSGAERVLAYDVEAVNYLDASATAAAVIAGATAFDPLRYVATYGDLIPAIGTDQNAAIAHYEQYGFLEGRSTGTFNAYAYLAANPDLAAAYHGDVALAETHYIQHGYAEGRPTSGFNAYAYLAANPDLLAAYGADTQAATAHYVLHGLFEGRATGGFDVLRYLASNPDLARGYGTDTTLGLAHYVEHGFAEGRSTTGFDPLQYLAANKDLAAAYGDNPVAAETHYIQSGLAEGRPTTGFDAVAYLLSSGDLAAAGLTPDQALLHWVTNGAAEGRVGDSLYGREQTSHALALNGSVHDIIDTNADHDWFAVTLAAGQHVSVQMYATDFGHSVAIADEHGVQQAGGQIGSGAAMIDFTASHAATYYIATAGLGDAHGDYYVGVYAL